MDKDPIWQVKFYGVRGSTPICDGDYQQFGGNTSCIYVDLLINDRSNMLAIFDAGTGIRKLGKEISSGKLPDTKFIFLAFTHFHWDHIQGLPFFEPAYNENKKIALFSPHEAMKDVELQRIFETQMQKEYFPIQLKNMGAELKFFTAEEYQTYLNVDYRIKFTNRLHRHPGGAFSYRMDAGGRSVVICTDLEHGETIDQKVVEFCRDADLLIHDAQYTDEELEAHRGWGHSSYSQAIACAKQANAKKLIFTHHDPDHNDDFLAIMEKKCQQEFPNCAMAREGMEILV